jgi:hypothetical protein
MNYEQIIGEALLGNDGDKQRALDRMEIKLRVCDQITCPGTGKVLDQARASVIENKTSDGGISYTSAYCAEYIDSREDDIKAAAIEFGSEYRILDGRVLFGNGGK